jgi:hypothetical protein
MAVQECVAKDKQSVQAAIVDYLTLYGATLQSVFDQPGHALLEWVQPPDSVFKKIEIDVISKAERQTAIQVRLEPDDLYQARKLLALLLEHLMPVHAGQHNPLTLLI